MFIGFIVVCFFLGAVYSAIGHLHKHVARQDVLIDWLVTRAGGDPEQVVWNESRTHYESEIGGPQNGL